MIRRRAITVLEVLVALVLCVFVAGLAVVLLNRHRENANVEQCKNNLRRMGLAIRGYHGTAEEQAARMHLPPSRIAADYATWAVLIMPHMVDKHPLSAWDVQLSYFDQAKEIREAAWVGYLCPARTRSSALSVAGDLDPAGQFLPGAVGDYATVAGDGSPAHDWKTIKANGAIIPAVGLQRKADRILQWKSLTTLDSLTRGQSYTLLVGEKHVLADQMGDAAAGDGSLYSGQHPACFSRVVGPRFPLASSMHAPFNSNFGSWHVGIVNFLMADASVRQMTPSTSVDVLGQLAVRGD